MNQSYFTIWNDSIGAWVAAPEITRARGKRGGNRVAVNAAGGTPPSRLRESLRAGITSALLAIGWMGWASSAQAQVNCSAAPYNYYSGSATCAGFQSQATFGGSTALGYSALSTALNATAVGYQAIASGINSIYMGARTAGGTGALGQGAIGIGTDVAATVDGTVAIGIQARSTGTSAVAMGTASRAWGNQSIAFGLGANAGVQANTAVPNAIAIGVNSSSLANSSIALGTAAAASADGSAAIGRSAAASAINSLALGNDTVASNINTVALGINAQATAAGASALGTASTATGGNSTAVGVNSVAGGNFAFAGGFLSQATAVRTVAVGNQAEATTDAATAVGNAARALGNSSLALGAQALAVGTSTVAIGQGAGAGSTAANTGSVALGIASGALVTGAQNTAIGGGIASVMRGAGSGVTGTRNVAFGVGDGTVAYDATLDAAAGSLVSGNDNIAIGTNAGIGVASNATTSIGLNANASVGNAVAIGTQASASALDAVAQGSSANAAGRNGIAIGFQSVASQLNSINLGARTLVGAGATAPGAIAIGTDVAASQENAAALGVATKATGINALALGIQANAAADNAIAMGANAVANSAEAVAIGTNATATGGRAVSLGSGNVANGNGAVAIGDPNTATGNGAIASGLDNTATGNGSVAMGNTNMVGGGGQAVSTPGTAAQGAVGIGFQNQVIGQGSVAIGSTSRALAAGAVAFGDTAVANNAGDVALGSGSVTAVAVPTTSTVINGVTFNFAGTTPTRTVSVGASGSERTITNVAAGRISGTSTDAINGSQLFATHQAVEAAAATANAGWNITDGTNSGNIAPSETLRVGAGSNAAVTFNDATGTLTVGVVADPSFNSITVGDTVINNGSIGFTSGGPSITNTGINAGGTTITNVAPGVAGTDAVNLNQLNQTVAANVTHYYSVNDNGVQGGNYNNDGATGINALAAGVGASSTGAQGVALGNNASVTTDGAVALGAGSASNRAVVPQTGGIIAGSGLVPYNTTDKILLGAVSVGNATSYRQITNVADGTEDQDAVTLRQLRGGLSSFAVTPTMYFHANSAAADSLAVGAESVAIGPTTVVNGDNGIGIGNGALVESTAPGGTAIGQNSTVNFADGIALGTNSASNGVQAVALGAGATANEPGSVALGAGSVTAAAVPTSGTVIGGNPYNFAGTTPTSTVSVGAVGAERTITNVAAGRIANDSTDAINGSQLFGTNQQVTANTTSINNLNNTVGGINNGAGIKYFHATSTLPDSQALGTDSVAIGPNAVANNAGDIALGSGSTTEAAVPTSSAVIGGTTYNFAGTTPASTVSVGAVGAERTITNVAAGRISGTSTDAINGSQLFATNQQVTANTTSINNLTNGGGIKYFHANSALPDSQALGTNSVAIGPNAVASNTGDVALGLGSSTAAAVGTPGTVIDGITYSFAGTTPTSTVSVGAVGAERTITNVAAGRIAIGSTDAINGSQLFATNQSIENLSSTVNANRIRYYSVNSTGGGNEDNLSATGANAIASGKDAAASGANSIAQGLGASATVDGSIALGSGSVSDRVVAGSTGDIPAGSSLIPYNTTDRTLQGAVSVGSATSFRQITNVADGTQAQDAVTVRQLSGALQSFAVTPIQYFHANSTGTDSLAIGAESVAVGPRTVVNGDNGVGIGNGAVVQQTAPGGVAIGQGATSHRSDSIALGTQSSAAAVQGVAIGAGTRVTQAGGVALGAGSVASTAAGAAGYVPTGASTSQIAVVQATTSTLSAVSVGDASTGQFRQINGLAAGSLDSDAVNVSQLKAVQNTVASIDQSAVKYETNADGSTNYNSVSLGGTNTSAPVSLHNIADGVAGNDAVNVNQLRSVSAASTAYTDARVNALGNELHGVARNAYAGVAAAMAVQMPGSYVPGKTVMRLGYGVFKGESAVGVSFRRTAENNGWSVTGGVGLSRAGPAATVGAEWVFN